jgi:homoserine dehydrogenase
LASRTEEWGIGIAGIAVRDLAKAQASGLDRIAPLTTDPAALAASDDVDVVVELMGGLDPAMPIVEAALKAGRPVVTANKLLLATFGARLESLARSTDAALRFESAVAAGVPVIGVLARDMSANEITSIRGIINGTTNYILTKMHEDNREFADVLAEAQKLGYAEADPTADVEGFDAAAKAAILSGLAFHTRVTVDDVYREGISRITLEDVQIAKSMDHVIKLLAIAELTPSDEISVRVHPVLLHKSHPLASVRDAFNAVFIEAESAGPLMFYGRGAGGAPTASAILGDVVAVSRHIALNSIGQRETDYADRDIAPIEITKTKFLIRLEVQDKSGVLATIAQTFAEQHVSIQTVDQNGRDDEAELIIVTHGATEGELKATVAALKKLSIVSKISSVIRVEGSTSL